MRRHRILCPTVTGPVGLWLEPTLLLSDEAGGYTYLRDDGDAVILVTHKVLDQLRLRKPHAAHVVMHELAHVVLHIEVLQGRLRPPEGLEAEANLFADVVAFLNGS